MENCTILFIRLTFILNYWCPNPKPYLLLLLALLNTYLNSMKVRLLRDNGLLSYVVTKYNI